MKNTDTQPHQLEAATVAAEPHIAQKRHTVGAARRRTAAMLVALLASLGALASSATPASAASNNDVDSFICSSGSVTRYTYVVPDYAQQSGAEWMSVRTYLLDQNAWGGSWQDKGFPPNLASTQPVPCRLTCGTCR